MSRERREVYRSLALFAVSPPLGKGVYFSVSASAEDGKALTNQQGEQLMFFACLLVGDFVLGQQDMRDPAPHDTATDNLQTPTQFVIFRDTQAYPEFLILYK